MGREIERKFLTNSLVRSVLNGKTGTVFHQAYIVTERSKTIRVRIAGYKAYLTIKGETQGVSRIEFEYEIPVEDASQLISLFAGKVLKKTRYNFYYEGFEWDIDVFHENNEGLIVAEIELESEDQQFPVPPWIGQEVSGVDKYFNSYLVEHPFVSWEKEKISHVIHQ